VVQGLPGFVDPSSPIFVWGNRIKVDKLRAHAGVKTESKDVPPVSDAVLIDKPSFLERVASITQHFS
jgi:hypothetical protein